MHKKGCFLSGNTGRFLYSKKSLYNLTFFAFYFVKNISGLTHEVMDK